MSRAKFMKSADRTDGAIFTGWNMIILASPPRDDAARGAIAFLLGILAQLPAEPPRGKRTGVQ